MLRRITALLLLTLCCAVARATDYQVHNSTELAAAINNAAGGDTITLDTSGTFVGSFTLPAKSSLVTLRTSAYASLPAAGVRLNPATDGANLAVVTCSPIVNDRCFNITGSNWKLLGLDLRNMNGVTANTMVLVGTGAETSLAQVPDNIQFDHCYVHALHAGIVRGLYLNATNAVVRDSWFEGFRNNGQECQTILLANGLGATIDNNFLSAVGEVVLSNGAGAKVMFGDLSFTRNYLLVPQKYNPWNHTAFDGSDAAETAVLSCAVSSSGTTLTCAGHGQTDALRVIKLTSGPQTGQQRTIISIPDANTLIVDQPFTANQTGASANVYRPFVHKNNFELKTLTGTNNVIEGNVFDGSWHYGQNGQGIVLTVRTDGGVITGAVIKNLSFRYNLHRNFYMSWLGMITHEDCCPTGLHMQNVAITDNLVLPLRDPLGSMPDLIRADTIFISQGMGRGSDGLTISHNTLDGNSMPTRQTAIGFNNNPDYTPRHTRLVIKDNVLLFGAGDTAGVIAFNPLTAGSIAALNLAAESDHVFTNNAFLYAPSTSISGYHANSWFEPTRAPLNFADPANIDYTINSGTTYAAGGARAADDCKALGADTQTLATNIGASSSAFATATINAVTGNWPSCTPPTGVIISEFRLRGANGASDEFVELYNTNNTPVTVCTADGSRGWALVASDGVPRFVVPAGTVIPANGHYLGTNNVGYSLSNYGGCASGDAIYTGDIADDTGIALFNTSTPANFILANRLDAVGFNTESNSLYREGAGLSAISTTSGEYSHVRLLVTGVPQDTDSNASDFAFVSTNAGSYNGVQSQLGAPGPENLASPIQRNATIKASVIDPLQASTSPPNRVRDNTPNVCGNSSVCAFGTLTFRRKFKNTTGQTVTRLRFRIVDITTLNSPGYTPGGTQADLRALDSADVTVTITGGTQVLVKGSTVEQPPTQTMAGGLNSTFVVALPGGALAPNASVNVQFVLGVQQGGTFRFLINTEGLP